MNPPPELIATLLDDAPFRSNQIHERDRWLIEEAYKAGADQELKACCAWLPKLPPWSADDLRRHRRPKPPSLKEQALQAWCRFQDTAHKTADEMMGDMTTIRRALEALDD
jgi:hypothetical protein